MNSPKSILNFRPAVVVFSKAVLILALLGFAVNASSQSVRTEFTQALRFYQQGEMGRSLAILKRLVKKYPDYRASHFLIGRIYFHYGAHRQAARWFAKGGDQFLSADNAYEYGLAMFSVNRCRQAREAFQLIPGNSPNKGVTNFYSGVCYIKARAWAQAEAAFRRADNLPRPLEARKRFFLRQIYQKKRTEQRGLVARPIPYYYVPLPPPAPAPLAPYDQYQGAPPPLPPGPGAPPAELAKKDRKLKVKEPKPKTGFFAVATPKVEYYSRSLSANRHGTGEEVRARTGPNWDLKLVPNYALPPDRHGQQTVFNVEAGYRGQSYKTTTKNVSYFLEGGEDFVTREEVTPGSAKFYEIYGTPRAETPLGSAAVIGIQGIFRQIYVQNSADRMEQVMGGGGDLNVNIGSLNIELLGQQTKRDQPVVDTGEIAATDVTLARVDVDAPLFGPVSVSGSFEYFASSEPTYVTEELTDKLKGFRSTMVYEAGVSATIEKVLVSLTATHFTRQPPEDLVIDGTVTENKGVGKLGYSFDFGLSLSGSATYAQIGEYNKLGLKTNAEREDENAATSSVSATATRTGFAGDLKLTPISWGYMSATYSQDRTTYNISDANYQVDFETKVPDLITITTYIIGLTHSF